MSKRVIGISILILLFGLVIYNFIDNSNEPNEPTDSSATQEGEMAPDFTLETLSGEEVQLSDYFGKKVILNFWATHCPPCREEMPEMQRFYDKYSDEVEILAVNLTGTEVKESDVSNFIDEFDYTYPTLLDEDLEVREDYQAYGIPTTYFVGTDGKIQAPKKIGAMDYDFMVETIESMD